MVYNANVRKFAKGEMGAVNASARKATRCTPTARLRKCGPGPPSGVASHMIAEGMRDQGFATAKGVYNVVWRDRGYFFRTPRPTTSGGLFRASMYMRPGAIWSMEYASTRSSLSKVAGPPLVLARRPPHPIPASWE